MMEWPLNWEPVTPEAKRALEAELKREVRRGHPLYSVPVEAVARRDDCDEVLFSLDGSSAVAVVHLSYSLEKDSSWPHTQAFDSHEEWRVQV